MTAYRIAPSILSADFARLGEEVRAVIDAGSDFIHFDVMDKLDMILLMSVNPGFGGQSFIPAVLQKASMTRSLIDGHRARGGQDILLEIDGGVKVDNIRAIAQAGVDTFVAGSAIFGKRDPDGGYREVLARLRSELAGVGEPARAS